MKVRTIITLSLQGGLPVVRPACAQPRFGGGRLWQAGIPQRRDKLQPETGFTLIESILALFVVAILVSLLVGLASVRHINRSTAYRAQAAALADEELNALRRLDYNTLSDQTNGSFKNILYNAGGWKVIADAAAASVPNVLELAQASGFTNKESGRLLFPADSYRDVTLEAKWKAVTGSPASWSVGYVLRSQDAGNGYRLRIATTDTDLNGGAVGAPNIVFEKLVNNAVTVFSSANATIATDSWYTLSLQANGNTFTVKLDSNTIFSVSDSTWTSGFAALIAWDGVHAEVDDVTTTIGASTTTWNFDSPTTPSMPAAWIRLGLNNLPDSTATTFDDNGTLTIEPYPDATNTTLKKITLTITWVNNGVERTYTTSSLIGKSGLGQ